MVNRINKYLLGTYFGLILIRVGTYENVYDLILNFQRIFSLGEKAVLDHVNNCSVSNTSLSQLNEINGVIGPSCWVL